MAITISEKDLEDLIFEDYKSNLAECLQDRGWPIYLEYPRIHRQVKLGGYGIADLIVMGSFYDEIQVHVIELKVTPLCLDHLSQLARYIKAIKEIISKSNLIGKVSVHGILIVESIPINDNVFIPNILQENISIYSAKYGLYGIEFSQLDTSFIKSSGIGNFDEVFGNGSFQSLESSHLAYQEERHAAMNAINEENKTLDETNTF